MHVVVVGAGVFGVWTAHHLLHSRARVTLVDAYGPANARASSGDESRIIRCGYGSNALYSRWARESLAQWQDLVDRAGGDQFPLFHQCGVLWLAPKGDSYSHTTYETLRREGYPIIVLDAATLRKRFPHIATTDLDMALFEPDCGVLMARRAVQTLARDLERGGARVTCGRIHMPPSTSGHLDRVELDAGGGIDADAFVFACGPWLPKVFPDLLSGRIRPTRQVVIYFGSASANVDFGPAHTPAWVDFAAGIYGVPDLEHRGIKVGIDRHGPPFDPDCDDRIVDGASIDIARSWLRERMPLLRDAPVVESRVCQYENTDTGDFLIDRHPDIDNVWIVGGGSGHGFKHGPAVGHYVADLIQRNVSGEPLFTMSRRGTTSQRTVY